MALVGSWMSERYGVGAILLPLAIIQSLAVVAAMLIHEPEMRASTGFINGDRAPSSAEYEQKTATRWFANDAGLWAFVAAMVLFHAANAPGGVYLGLFLKRDLHAPERMLAYAFVVSMVAWMIVVWPAGWLADRYGRKPLLVAGWTIMAVRLGLLSLVHTPWLAVANQALDGFGNGLFAVSGCRLQLTARVDPRRAGEAAGSRRLMPRVRRHSGRRRRPSSSGRSATGGCSPLWCCSLVATAIVAFFVPESLPGPDEQNDGQIIEPIATTSDLAIVP